MRIGAHVDPADPLAEAAARGAEAVQFFLTDPQSSKTPEPREDVERLRASEVDIYIHAPYRINVASPNNRIRIPSRKLLLTHARAAAEVGAKGLIVHGGHVGGGADLADGFVSWRKVFEYAESEGGFPLPILIENTAGGDNACARRFDDVARLWDEVGRFGAGFCLDTCHAFAGGEDLVGIVDRVKAITGRIDLIHANDSKGGFDSGQDRHDNLGSGKIDPELVVAAIRASGAPAIVETPGGVAGQSADIALLRQRSGA
ncbi:deoxyribonuclease IV [Actinoplanes regularis]|uniref:deoxyribonuclease IV n=1 Tax=Actinoplanes regularis TaxID=52697 RepID=UPI0024A4C1D4|nr:deoxyribonuclease IV [Actinoplanes regularis]GLW29924.1 deoxyribonuclease IV [Actinoplanes regularis]